MAFYWVVFSGLKELAERIEGGDRELGERLPLLLPYLKSTHSDSWRSKSNIPDVSVLRQALPFIDREDVKEAIKELLESSGAAAPAISGGGHALSRGAGWYPSCLTATSPSAGGEHASALSNSAPQSSSSSLVEQRLVAGSGLEREPVEGDKVTSETEKPSSGEEHRVLSIQSFHLTAASHRQVVEGMACHAS